MSQQPLRASTERDLRGWGNRLAVVGVFALGLGMIFSPARTWLNLLLIAYLLAGFGLGGAFFLAFQGVCGARWSLPLSPLAQWLAGTLPVTALATGILAVAGLAWYPWAQADLAHEPSFWFKHLWLSPGFFVARTALYLTIWCVLGSWMASSRWLRRNSAGELQAGGAGRSALALVLLSASVSLASFDWVMSLEPLWFSTMFGVLQFAGLFQSGLAALVLLAAWQRRSGTAAHPVDARVLHDLGKLLFGFSCFWMYIWFSQYLLIWYVHVPEEAVYYAQRTQGLWGPLTGLNVVLNWGLPFAVLISRPAKQNWRVMVRISTVILAGRWVDLYVAFLPPFAGEHPVCGWPELGALALTGGVLGLILGGLRPVALTHPSHVASHAPQAEPIPHATS